MTMPAMILNILLLFFQIHITVVTVVSKIALLLTTALYTAIVMTVALYTATVMTVALSFVANRANRVIPNPLNQNPLVRIRAPRPHQTQVLRCPPFLSTLPLLHLLGF